MSKAKIKLSIYAAALLMMGATGISGSLSVISEHFHNTSQTMITSLISVPCLVVIPVFLTSFTGLLIFRGIFGLGIGLIQTLTTALVAENFDGSEKERVQGNAASAQMFGCIIMSFASGRLGAVSWNYVFLVHLLAVIPLIFVLAFIPSEKPEQKNQDKGQQNKKHLSSMTWFWVFACLLFFIAAQAYSTSLSFFIAEKGLGTASQSGYSLSFFAFGGFLMGILFGRLMAILRNLTLSAGFLLLASAHPSGESEKTKMPYKKGCFTQPFY